MEVPTEARSCRPDSTSPCSPLSTRDNSTRTTASARPESYCDDGILGCRPIRPTDRPVAPSRQSPAGRQRGQQANTSNGTRGRLGRNRSQHRLSQPMPHVTRGTPQTVGDGAIYFVRLQRSNTCHQLLNLSSTCRPRRRRLGLTLAKTEDMDCLLL